MVPQTGVDSRSGVGLDPAESGRGVDRIQITYGHLQEPALFGLRALNWNRVTAVSLPADAILCTILFRTLVDSNTVKPSSGHHPKSHALQMAFAACLVVLMLLALVHVADAHSATNGADQCPICTVMHSVTPFVIMAVAMVLVRIGTQAPELFETSRDYPVLASKPLYSPSARRLLAHRFGFPFFSLISLIRGFLGG